MTDIIERLRACAQGVSLGAEGMGWSPDPELWAEAADEIERLRELVVVPVRLTETQKAKLQRIGVQRLRDWLDRCKE